MRFIVRMLLGLLSLLLVALVTVLLIAPDVVADAVLRLEQVAFAFRLGLVVVLYLLVLGGLYLRLRATPRAYQDKLAVNVAGSVTAVTVESVRERILKAISEVPGVASVDAKLKSVRGQADIELNVVTADDRVNLPEKQKEITRALEQVVRKQLGLQMAGRPRVNIQLGGVQPLPPAAPISPTPVSPAPVKSAPINAAPVTSDAPSIYPTPRPAEMSKPVEPATPPRAETRMPAPEPAPEPEPESGRGGLFGFIDRLRDHEPDHAEAEQVTRVIQPPTGFAPPAIHADVDSEPADDPAANRADDGNAALYALLEAERLADERAEQDRLARLYPVVASVPDAAVDRDDAELDRDSESEASMELLNATPTPTPDMPTAFSADELDTADDADRRDGDV